MVWGGITRNGMIVGKMNRRMKRIYTCSNQVSRLYSINILSNFQTNRKVILTPEGSYSP